jgi:threonylcarbamoyladenosine tRNA methylthiotransferase CDKAL1
MKKYYIETFGCKLNQADSERIKIELDKKYKLSSEKEADLVILNTCAVVERTEKKILKKALLLKKQGKIVIIAGCLPMISKECESVARGIIGPQSINLINKAIEGNICVSRQKKKPIIFTSKNDSCSVVVPIAEGCIGQCTYCAARLARKELMSFEIKDIIKSVKSALDLGYREIQLTSQDLSIYGLDKGKLLLPELLKELIAIKGDFKIKLGMMNPGITKKILKPLLKLYESDKLYKFIHIPLQSGSNDVLKKMKRNYVVNDFIEIVKSFKKKFKDSVIATDIIVGHPSETEKDYLKTLSAVKKTKPDIIHIFKFSRRKGTPDYELIDLVDRTKKERSRKLTQLFIKNNELTNKKFIKKSFNCLVINKNLARTDSGRAVVVNKGKIGYYEEVEIIDSKWNYLIGKVVEK